MGIVYAAMSDRDPNSANPDDRSRQVRGIRGQGDPASREGHRAADWRSRSERSRDAVAAVLCEPANTTKAVKMLTDLVNQEPGWQDGPMLLAEAYAGAGRTAEGITWLEGRAADDPRLLATLADFYERERRWSDAAAAYAKIVQRAPRNLEVKTRYAQTLLNAGGRDNIVKARDVLTEVVAGRAHRRVRAVSAVAGAAPFGRRTGGRGDRAAGDRAERAIAARLLLAGRGAR